VSRVKASRRQTDDADGDERLSGTARLFSAFGFVLEEKRCEKEEKLCRVLFRNYLNKLFAAAALRRSFGAAAATRRTKL
jgi:hypothetical protein